MLYLVATPIGNRDDMTVRALNILRSVELIVCEDVEETAALLRHFQLGEKPLVSLMGYDDPQARARIIEHLKSGALVALTTTGTPGVADPGNLLIQQVVSSGIEMTMLPGPCAFVMASILSGFPLYGFTFRGYPPRAADALQKFLQVDESSPHALVYYVLPERLCDVLRGMLHVFGDRKAALACDLTSDHESIRRGTLSELLHHHTARVPIGNFTLVLSGNWRLYTRQLARSA